MKIGFVGAGRMGGPMVSRLAAAGESVVVHARSPSRAEDRRDGCTAVAAVAEVAADADAVVICVHKDEQVRQVCFENGLLDAMEAGSVLIVHTTGNPRTVLDIAEAVSHRGVRVVDAPVSGGPHDIARGRVTTFVGGTADAFSAASSVIGHYSEPSFHTGGLGSGQMVKLVNNAVFASNIAILGAAVDVGGQLGIDESVLARCLQRGSAGSMALDNVVRAGAFATFSEAVGEFLDKDVAVVRHVADDVGVDLGLVGTALDHPRSYSHSASTGSVTRRRE